LSTDCGSGADNIRRVARYSTVPGTSAVHISAGISTRHGPGRPLRAMLNARRSAGTSISGVTMVSACFVTWRKFSDELKYGFM
jgi:hypothetical protein